MVEKKNWKRARAKVIVVKSLVMIAVLFLFCFGISGVTIAEENKTVISERSGPIPVVNQSPLQLLFLQPVPDRAETLETGRGSMQITTTVTNTLLSKQSPQFDATLDMEAVRTCLDVRYGLKHRIEVGVQIPYYYFYNGFLDGAIEDVEGVFGKVRGTREQEERNTFTYAVSKDGKSLISGQENTGGFGDTVIGIKKALTKQNKGWPSIGIRGNVKIPTGSKGKGFGSGEWDLSLGLMMEEHLGAFSLYGNADVVFPGDPYDEYGVSLREFYSCMFGVEYGFTPQFSAVGQFHLYTRPFEHTGVEVLDRRIYEILVGANYRFKNGMYIQGGMAEDIIDSTDASADVSLFLNFGRFF